MLMQGFIIIYFAEKKIAFFGWIIVVHDSAHGEHEGNNNEQLFIKRGNL